MDDSGKLEELTIEQNTRVRASRYLTRGERKRKRVVMPAKMPPWKMRLFVYLKPKYVR